MIGRKISLVVLVALSASACASNERPARQAPPQAAGMLLLSSGDETQVVDALSGTSATEGIEGVLSPGGSRLYRVAKGASELEVLDPLTGNGQGSVRVPRGFSVAVASPSGLSVALVEGEAKDPYLPRNRHTTRLLVVRPDEGVVQALELDGNFEPEAFSTDDSKLFLIEYLGDGSRYRVRVMRLNNERLSPIGRLTKFAPDSMRGTGRVQAYSPDLDVLYTLYTKQPPNTAHKGAAEIHDRGKVHAFIHVLHLGKGWAHCVDLPMPFGMDTAPASVLAVAPTGDFVYAGDGARLVKVDTNRLRVKGLEEVDPYDSLAPSIVTADGSLLITSGSTINVFDGDTLELIGRHDLPRAIRALGSGAEGAEVFAAAEDEVYVLDASTGAVLRTIPAPGVEKITYQAAGG